MMPATSFLTFPALRPTAGAVLALTLAGAGLSAWAADELVLPSVDIVGRTSSGAYYAQETAGAKTDLPVREIPQSVRVISRQAIDDLGATRLDDVLDYVGGVSRQNSFGGLWDNIAIRGLPGNENVGLATLHNGFSSGRGFTAPRDLAAVQRVEFLKGPAAALYGVSEPGGTLNIVSKRPQWKAAHSLEAYVGTHAHRRVAVDTTGPITDNLAYRLNAAVQNADSARDHISSRRRVLAPALTWRASADTLVEYSGEYLEHATPLDRGVVAVNNRLAAVRPTLFTGEPADGRVSITNTMHQLTATHQINDAWRARAGLSFRQTAIDGYSSEPSRLVGDQLWRQRRMRDYDSRDIAVQAEVQGNVELAGMQHELLVGAETFRFTMDTKMLRINPNAANPYAINIYAPVYGQAQPTPGPNTDTQEKQQGRALYVQDTIHLGEQWRLMAGLRLDHFERTLLNRRNGRMERQSPSAVSPRLGLSWLPNAQWTVYANAGTSFRPNVGMSKAATSFDPEKGRALELGAKWQSADRRMGATAAIFDIRKRNVLTADPADRDYSIAAGQVRSRGLELDVSGQISAHWRINASLLLNDVKVRRDNTLEVGGRLLNVPRVTGSVMAMYEGTLGNGSAYGIGAGLTHTGARLGEARTQAEAAAGTAAFELPAYTTAKLTSWWRVAPNVRLMLDVDNVFNRTYYSNSYSRLWVAPGAQRSVTLGAQVQF